MVTRLPPAEKLPLALRKNIRDEWENKKEGLEKELSDILGVPWSLKEINPNAIYPYAKEGYGKDSLGNCLAAYVNGAIYQLKSFASNFGDEGTAELNSIAHEHSLIIDIDENKKVSYCGVDIVDGKLRILFAENNLGTNVDYAVDSNNLAKALNEAPAASGSDSKLSYAARTNIRQEYDAKIEDTRKKIADMLEKPDLKLVPNFDDVFAKLKEAASKKGSDIREDWQSNIGYLMRMYFEGVAYQMNYQKFGDDEMLREGFNEAVEKGEIAFRLVDTMKYDTYGEVVVEDGTCWVQAPPKYYGTNVDYAAQKLLDQL